MNSDKFVCGAVAILGKPNVGKSTFMNKVLDQKLAIVSPETPDDPGFHGGDISGW